MRDFGSAVAAMEMAVKALGLEGQISVEMDSDNQTIILNREIGLEIVQPHGITSGVRAVVSSIDEDELDESFLSTDDIVEAVIEAVAQVVAQQTREHLYNLFETVDEDIDDE
jgi:hypothetical protein